MRQRRPKICGRHRVKNVGPESREEVALLSDRVSRIGGKIRTLVMSARRRRPAIVRFVRPWLSGVRHSPSLSSSPQRAVASKPAMRPASGLAVAATTVVGASRQQRAAAQRFCAHRCGAVFAGGACRRPSGQTPQSLTIAAILHQWRLNGVSLVQHRGALAAPFKTCRLTPRCSGRHPGDLSNVLASGVDQLWPRSKARPGGATELIVR